jgi:hypothetical protein
VRVAQYLETYQGCHIAWVPGLFLIRLDKYTTIEFASLDIDIARDCVDMLLVRRIAVAH